MNGIEPAAQSMAPPLLQENYRIARAVQSLRRVHPPNPLYDISLLEIAAAVRLYRVDWDDIYEPEDQICCVFASLNNTMSEKTTKKAHEKEPWKQ